MDCQETKRRSKRGGQRRRRALRDLPPGRAPVGFTVALDRVQRHQENLPYTPTKCTSTTLASPEVDDPQDPIHARPTNSKVPISAVPDMFGPQARAAELQAMRSQIQRQKSHDNEEPPQPAPVSLTDFGRNVVQNRNKGIKTFKPFNLADINEDLTERDSSQSSLSLMDGPGPAVAQPIIADTPLNRTRISQSSSPKAPPSAPKAMLRLALSPATFAKQIKSPLLLSSQVSSDKQGFGVLSRQNSAPPATPRHNRTSVESPEPKPTPQNANSFTQSSRNDFLFGLEQYCPSKPEDKQQVLYNHLAPRYSEVLQSSLTSSQQLHTSSNVNAEVQYQAYQSSPMHYSYPINAEFPYCVFDHRFPYTHEAQIAHHNNIGMSPAHQKLDVFGNDTTFRDDKLRTANHSLSSLLFGGQYLSPAQHVEQPYDRSTKMQNFVAAQQAMAKTGKTVLHNPSLHKTPDKAGIAVVNPTSQHERNIQNIIQRAYAERMSPVKFPASLSPFTVSSEVASQLPKRSAATSMEQGICETPGVRRQVEECPAILRALQNRDRSPSKVVPPELPPQKTGKSYPWPMVEYRYSSDHHPINARVDTEQLFDMYISQDSRKQTRKLFRSAAAKATNQHDVATIGNRNVIVGPKSSGWIQSATIQDERRKLVERIIDNHMEESSNNPQDFGIIGKPSERQEDPHIKVSAMKAVANVMITIEQYSTESRQTEKPMRFGKVPANAIDPDAFYNAELRSVFERYTGLDHRFPEWVVNDGSVW